MIRAAVFACFVGFFLAAETAPTYETKVWYTNRNGVNNKNGIQVMQYLIKSQNSTNLQPDSPVFYGVGGRVSAEDLKNQYTLFDKQFTDLGSNNTITPTVVYVAQRFFGENDNIGKVNSFTDFADLTVDNAVYDHVEIIKKLSTDLNTKNFLVFGGGHGGLLAGYVATKFATDDKLKKLNMNVLGWASSPPIKYIRAGTDFSGTDLQEINYQLSKLLVETGGCSRPTDIVKFQTFFKGIKDWRNSDTAVRNDLKLDPKPEFAVAGATTATNDQKELAVYIRNQIISLTFNNNKYDSNGKQLNADRNLKKLCGAISGVNSPLTAAKFNEVLAILTGSTGTVSNWKLKKADGTYEKSLAASYYQDCTEYRLTYCPSGGADSDDPLKYSQWDEGSCNNMADYDRVIQTECQGLFGPGFTSDSSKYVNPYARSFTNKVITTVNTLSIFGSDYETRFKDDKNATAFSTNWQLWGTDNIEFQAPKTCDTAKMKDVRYLVMRAFGCASGFIDPSDNVCNSTNLFDDEKDNGGKAYNDDEPSSTSCPDDNSDVSKFPFGHKNVTIIKPGYVPTSTVTTPQQPTQSTKAQTQPPVIQATTSGVDSIFSAAFVLFSSMFLWTAARAL